MAEELEHPGVYIREGPRGPRPIAGVPTSLAAFVGETELGPPEPTRVRSLAEFAATFGAGSGYLAAGVAGFFGNGGAEAVVARVAGAALADYEAALAALDGEAGQGVSLVYAPDAAATPGLPQALIAHCERRKDRFAVLDAPASGDPVAARADWVSPYAACYHPWIEVADGAGDAPRPARRPRPRRLRPHGRHRPACGRRRPTRTSSAPWAWRTM
jgi:phage tail sheath protein FI